MKKIIILAVSVIVVVLLFFFGMNFFGNSSVKKANRFISKVEEQINLEGIKDDICIIEKNGDLLCENQTITLDNKLVNSGQLIIIDGKIADVDIVVDNKNLINVDNEIVVNNKKDVSVFVAGDSSGAEKPILYSNKLIPVVHDGTNWVVADVNSQWYDYTSRNWANAVVLRTGVIKEVGNIVNIDTEVQGMFVWIPRYEYKIENIYGKSTSEHDGTQLMPGLIEVNFIEENTSVPTKGYTIPSAFYFNGKELSGIWVSKFNTSTSKDNECYNADLNMSEEYIAAIYDTVIAKCNTGLTPFVLPNVRALRYQNAYNQHATALKMNLYISNMNSHMSKNSEYAAVLYLTNSKYGKYGDDEYQFSSKRINPNNNSNYITGCGERGINYKVSDDCNEYVTTYGMSASTTGNITGIYDMTGILRIRVMGYLNADYEIETTNNFTSAGFKDDPNPKYANIFELKENILDYDVFNQDEVNAYISAMCASNSCIGQGLSEFYRWGENQDSYTYKFPTIENPWITRGGGNQFNFMSDRGIAQNDITFRITLIDN